MYYAYKVAYLDKDCSSFHGLPYIVEDTYESIDDAKKMKKELETFRYKCVTIFRVPCVPDEITWGYVEENKV